MAKITKKISVDVAEQNRFAAIVAKQYDKSSRFLNVQLLNEEVPFGADLGATVVINARREDDTAKSFVGTVEADGTVTVPLAYWMLELDGTVICDISIVNGENMLTTCLFELQVQEAAADEQSIKEDDDYGILIQLIESVKTTATTLKNTYETSAKNMRDQYEASMAQAVEDCEKAVEAASLVTEPFYIVDDTNSKTYNAAFHVRNGKPFLVYDEFEG